VAKIAATPVSFGSGGLFRSLGNGIKKLARGGLNFFRNAGVPSGPSHAQGGIDLIDNRTGARLAEMEGGEPIMVLSKSTYANNSEVVDKLLHSSLYGGGKKVKLASGGVLGTEGAGDGPGGSNGGQAMLNVLQNIERNTAAFPTKLKANVVLSDLEDQATLKSEIDQDANF